METVPRLYAKARPGADYEGSLELFRQFHTAKPTIPTKSGLMLGIGETEEEVEIVMRDLLAVGCSMLTLGQYLQPSKSHLAVEEYVTPAQFDRYSETAKTLGFKQVASAPLVRSSYHADLQAKALV
jgi:lipoic acid synthetase